MNRCQRVLVTGAAGFIGSTVVDRLLAEGREVVGLDSFDPFYPEALKRHNVRKARDCERFRLVEGDIRDEALVERVFTDGGFDGVVHLAALAGVRPSLERPGTYADVNVNGTTLLFQAGARHGLPRFVFASSSSVYGEREVGPFRETDLVERPISPYAATKKAGELLAHVFHHTHGLPVCCVRIFTAYGPRQRPDLAIRKFAELMRHGESIPLFGDGSTVRDYTFVDDLVDGLVRCLDRNLGYAVLNLGAGRTVSLLEVVRALEDAMGEKARIEWLPRRVGDVSRTWADVAAARATVGYEPSMSLEDGIRRFVTWLEDAL